MPPSLTPPAKVWIWPAGGEDDAVSQYRLLMPMQALQAESADVRLDRRGAVVMWNRPWKGIPPPDARVVALAEIPQCETVVMQRPARRWDAEVIPMLQEAGVRVVVDVDDDFNAIHKDSKAYDPYDPDQQGWHNRDWITEACKSADLVTASTPALVKTYGFGHGMLIPNFVPARYLGITPNFKREKTVGWTGKVSSHPGDLESTRGKVAQAVEEHGWGFHLLGNPDGVQRALGLAEEPSVHAFCPFGEYPSRMAEIEVGIVPLGDTRFNKAKSALKLMEFASLGVPVLGSATPDNCRMNEHGIGLVVKRPHQWGKILKTVLESPEYRAELAGNGRERMAAFTYENNAWRWGFAWRCDTDRIHNLKVAAS